jgi:hypothetical protein
VLRFPSATLRQAQGDRSGEEEAKMLKRNALVLFFIILSLLPPAKAYSASCCGAKSGGGPRVGAFSGNVMKKGDFLVDPHDDTLEYLFTTYGYYGNSWSPDGHSGDPLGTGGKWPLASMPFGNYPHDFLTSYSKFPLSYVFFINLGHLFIG